MELPTYSGLRLERRIYQLGELRLPQAYTVREVAVFAAALGAMLLLSWLLGLPLVLEWAWLYLLLPGLAARLALKPLAEGRPLHLWALAQLRHLLFEPRLLVRLRPPAEPSRLRLRVEVWRPRRRAAPASPEVLRR